MMWLVDMAKFLEAMSSLRFVHPDVEQLFLNTDKAIFLYTLQMF